MNLNMLQVKRITALALLFLIHTTVSAQEDFAVWLDGVGEEAKRYPHHHFPLICFRSLRIVEIPRN